MYQQHHYRWFSNIECHNCYEKGMHSRDFLCEWRMLIKDVEEELQEFNDQWKVLRWEILTEPVPLYNMKIVQKFYANLLWWTSWLLSLLFTFEVRRFYDYFRKLKNFITSWRKKSIWFEKNNLELPPIFLKIKKLF